MFFFFFLLFRLVLNAMCTNSVIKMRTRAHTFEYQRVFPPPSSAIIWLIFIQVGYDNFFFLPTFLQFLQLSSTLPNGRNAGDCEILYQVTFPSWFWKLILILARLNVTWWREVCKKKKYFTYSWCLFGIRCIICGTDSCRR